MTLSERERRLNGDIRPAELSVNPPQRNPNRVPRRRPASHLHGRDPYSLQSGRYQLTREATPNGGYRGLLDLEISHAPTALRGASSTGTFQHDAPHQLGRESEEVSAVLPVHGSLIDELNVGFVNERGRLEGVTALSDELASGEALELSVDRRHQRFDGRTI